MIIQMSLDLKWYKVRSLGWVFDIYGSISEAKIRKKRKIQRDIFLGFTNHPDKEDFELERLNSALAEISLDALELLAIIKER